MAVNQPGGKLRHDVTPSGDPVNSFTQGYRIVDGSKVPAVPPASKVRPLPPLTRREMSDRRLRRIGFDRRVGPGSFAPGVQSPTDSPIGYRWMEPERASALASDLVSGDTATSAEAKRQIELTSWLSGAKRAFPNAGAARGNPAINEPHEVSNSSEVVRRWEDLSEAEVSKAENVMGLAGFPADRSGRATTAEDVQTGITLRNMFRVMGEHAASGVSENVSQHFYSGTPQTHIPDPALRQKRDAAHSDTQDAFQQIVVDPLMQSKKFQESVEGLPPEKVQERARYIGSALTSRTSPNTRFRQIKKKTGEVSYPNLAAAAEVRDAASEDRSIIPKNLSTSRMANAVLGLEEAKVMLGDASARSPMVRTSEVVVKVDPKTGEQRTTTASRKVPPKTGPFVTAMAEGDSADAALVDDVMESQQNMPHLQDVKGRVYEHIDTKTKKPSNNRNHPDVTTWQGRTAAPRGYRVKRDTEGKPVSGKNEAEMILEKGGGLVHAFHDKANRNVLTAMGLSRGVNYADNINAAQAARWGSEQMGRESHSTSHAEMYPVVRDWAAESVGITERPSWTKNASQFDWMYENRPGPSSGPQFADNPNTEGWGAGDVLRRKPYVTEA